MLQALVLRLLTHTRVLFPAQTIRVVDTGRHQTMVGGIMESVQEIGKAKVMQNRRFHMNDFTATVLKIA